MSEAATKPEIEKTEFTFPDPDGGGGTVVETKPDAVEIEVVDDTPEADRGRKPMAEAPVDPTDDELASYSEGVKKRIQHFTKGYHDERRAKETAARERDEAVRVAQALVAENKKLQGSLTQGQTALLEQAKKQVAREMEDARAAMKAAQEAFDTDAIVAAQEKMLQATMRAERVKNYRPAPLQTPQNVVQTQQQAPQPARQAAPADPKAQKWLENNQWFGEDDEMSSFAMGVHNKLVRSNVDATSDEYYEALNARMREVFPSKFDREQPQAGRKISNVVASAKRSTAPKKIVLTSSAVSLAKRLGIPLEVYARQVAEDMRK